MTDINAYRRMYQHPLLDYTNTLLPQDIKSTFSYLEYLYANSGQVYPVIKKFSDYAITEVTYECTIEKVKTQTKELFDETLNIKSVLINISNDFHLYGNAFITMYRPFTRLLGCTSCKKEYNVEAVAYSWDPKAFEYEFKCPSCGKSGVASVKNMQLRDKAKINFVRWDPKLIDIEYNPITGKSRYFYQFPAALRNELHKKTPSPFILNAMPWEYIKAMKGKQLLRFHEGKIFHLKNPSPAGVSQEWGFPGLLCALKPYFYMAVLKKANEAIAMERLTPWRIIFPQASSSGGDPSVMMNLHKWREQLETAVNTWRRDPNAIKTSPIPIGMQELGGNGRGLMLQGEIKQEEENTIVAMGVPLEFVRGGLTNSGGSVTLRMLENVLFTYSSQLQRALQWMTNEATSFLGWEKVKTGLIPFKLVDDVQQKQLMLQLWSEGKVSDSTASEYFNVDVEKERVRIKNDSVKAGEMEKDITRSLNDMKSSISEQIRDQVSGNPLTYDPMKVLEVAQEQAMNMLNMPPDVRKQQMDALMQSDPVMHAVVGSQIKSLVQQQREQQQQQQMYATPGGQQTGSGPSVGSPQNQI